jgi:DnaK suppressor protein
MSSTRSNGLSLDGTYGVSIESGQPIPDARLEAIPWAERTAEEQARHDP